MKKSGLVLLIVFVVPIAVVLFLQFFGDNRFDVPVYHQEEGFSDPNCAEGQFPYRLDKEYMTDDMLSIVLFIQDGVTEALILQVFRICDKTKNDPVKALSYMKEEYPGFGCIERSIEAEEKLRQLRTCVYKMAQGTNAVLVDGNGYIRGYYNLNERDETDRLAVEIDILLQNEEHQSK